MIGDTGKFTSKYFTDFLNSTGVGKSCILARLIENEFSNEHNVTIGVEFGNYVMRIDGQHII